MCIKKKKKIGRMDYCFQLLKYKFSSAATSFRLTVIQNTEQCDRVHILSIISYVYTFFNFGFLCEVIFIHEE